MLIDSIKEEIGRMDKKIIERKDNPPKNNDGQEEPPAAAGRPNPDGIPPTPSSRRSVPSSSTSWNAPRPSTPASST